MYYPELLEVVKRTGAKEAIEKLDKYLAFLPNRTENIITPSNVASRLELDFNIVDMMLGYIYEIGLFEKVYVISCPECGREISVSNKQELLNKAKELDFCIKCKSQIKIAPEDIYWGYKILKQPDLDQKEIIKETEKLLGKQVAENKYSDLDSLTKMFEEKREKPHDFFYDPSEADKKSLKEAFRSLDYDYGSSTTDQGGALEGLACRLFNICTGMTATPVIRSETNQIDCTVRNDYCIPLTIYNELGSIVKAECKNEPKKTPGNTYYHKLHGIIEMCKNEREQAVGIIFSRKKAARTCDKLAREFFLRDRIIIVNIYDHDLDRIINRNANFLDVLQEKIQTVKHGITTDPEKHRLYRESNSMK